MEKDQFSEYAGMGQETGPQQGIIVAELSPVELTTDMVEVRRPVAAFGCPWPCLSALA